MNSAELMRAVLKATGTPITHVGPALGKPDSYCGNFISRGSKPAGEYLASMLKVCGYSLVALPDAEVPADALVLDPTLFIEQTSRDAS